VAKVGTPAPPTSSLVFSAESAISGRAQRRVASRFAKRGRALDAGAAPQPVGHVSCHDIQIQKSSTPLVAPKIVCLKPYFRRPRQWCRNVSNEVWSAT
jgi:hypothetical protein